MRRAFEENHARKGELRRYADLGVDKQPSKDSFEKQSTESSDANASPTKEVKALRKKAARDAMKRVQEEADARRKEADAIRDKRDIWDKVFDQLGWIALLLAGLLIYALYQMIDREYWGLTTVILVFLSVLVYSYCCESGGSDESLFCTSIFFCLFYRNVRMVCKLIFSILLFFTAIFTIFEMVNKSLEPSGPQGHLANFADAVTTPVQMVVDGFIYFLAILAMIAAFGFFGLEEWAEAHPTVSLTVIAIVYLTWLGTNAYQVADKKLACVRRIRPYSRNNPYTNEGVSKNEIYTWAVVYSVIWATFLVSTPFALKLFLIWMR